MNVTEAIRKKRAIREYTDQPLPDEVVRAILDAGRRAQSSKNSQPWHFIAVQNRETLQALSTMGRYASHMQNAALGVLLVSQPGKDFDLGQAAAYMQLTALEHGVGSCLVAIYEPEQAAQLLGIQGDYQVRMAIAFGYPTQAALENRLGQGRKSLDEVAHWEKW